MAKRTNSIYVGTGRFVLALDAETGTELWRTKLPSTISGVVSLMLDGPNLFVGHCGRVFRLSALTGAIEWQNGLPRTGYSPVIMAAAGIASSMGAVVAAAALVASKAAAGGAAS